MGVVKLYQKAVAKYGVAGKVLSDIDARSMNLQIAQVTLTAAQIKLLKDTPQTLVAAPGAAYVTVIDTILCALDYATAVFSGANNLEIRETNGSGTKVSADITSTFLNGNADAICEVKGIEAQTTRLANAAVVVCVPTANPGGATAASTLTFTVFYKTVNVYAA